MMYTCRHATEHASEYLDGTLPRVTGLRLHLLICRNCRRYLAQIRSVRNLLSGLTGAPPSDAIEAWLMESFCKTHSAAADNSIID